MTVVVVEVVVVVLKITNAQFKGLNNVVDKLGHAP